MVTWGMIQFPHAKQSTSEKKGLSATIAAASYAQSGTHPAVPSLAARIAVRRTGESDEPQAGTRAPAGSGLPAETRRVLIKPAVSRGYARARGCVTASRVAVGHWCAPCTYGVSKPEPAGRPGRCCVGAGGARCGVGARACRGVAR